MHRRILLAALACVTLAFHRTAAIAAPPVTPTTVPTGDAFARRIHDQLYATHPDFVAFVPDPTDDTTARPATSISSSSTGRMARS